MKRKTRKAVRLTAEHAARALHALVADGKLAARDVTTALKRRRKLIRKLKDRFAALENGTVSATARAGKEVARKAASKPRRSAGAAPNQRRQGRYLAAIRRLSKQDRARIQSIRRKAGAGAAIKAAEEVARKKEIARSTRRKAVRPGVAGKAAVARRQTPQAGRGTQLSMVKADTNPTARKAAMTRQERHPSAGGEGRIDTPAAAQAAEGTGVPDPGKPEQGVRGPAEGLRDSIPQSERL